MRRYFLVTVGIAAICIILHYSIILFVPAPISGEYWVRETIVLKQRFARARKTPGIIILGGSSTLFGIDAKQISRDLGVPAFNMGLHVELRLDRLLAIGKSVVRSGDIVVLALEPVHYACDTEAWDNWQLENTLAWDREYFVSTPLWTRINAIFTGGVPSLSARMLATKVGALVRPEQYAARNRTLASDAAIVARYQSGSDRTNTFSYSAYNIDPWGDMTNIADARYVGDGSDAGQPGSICPSVKHALSKYVADMKSVGVRVFIANVPYLIDGATKSGWQDAEEAFQADVSATGAVLIDRREELFMSRDQFFNTNLHLNEVGRRRRTTWLITHLKTYLKTVSSGINSVPSQ